MPEYTENFNLVKPLPSEYYDVDVFNQNAEIIDAAIQSVDAFNGTATNAPSSNMVLPMQSTGGEKYRIDYDVLADAILNKLTLKTYTMDAGSSTLIGAINSLDQKIPKFDATNPIPNITPITGEALIENTDLNDYLTVGKYSCSVHDIAKTIANLPVGKAGALYVVNVAQPDKTSPDTAWSYFEQIYIALGGDIYIRYFERWKDSEIHYGPWKQIASATMVDSGSYTPQLWAGTANRELFCEYINQYGRDYKIGNLCYVSARIKAIIAETNERAYVTLPFKQRSNWWPQYGSLSLSCCDNATTKTPWPNACILYESGDGLAYITTQESCGATTATWANTQSDCWVDFSGVYVTED